MSTGIEREHQPVILTLYPTDCLGVFDHFVGLAYKGLNAFLRNLANLYFEEILQINKPGSTSII